MRKEQCTSSTVTYSVPPDPPPHFCGAFGHGSEVVLQRFVNQSSPLAWNTRHPPILHHYCLNCRVPDFERFGATARGWLRTTAAKFVNGRNVYQQSLAPTVSRGRQRRPYKSLTRAEPAGCHIQLENQRNMPSTCIRRRPLANKVSIQIAVICKARTHHPQ